MKIGHVFTALIGVLSLTLIAQAQGIIFPRPCPRPIIRCPQPTEVPQRPLRVKSIRFTAKITDQVSVTHVEQVFENDTPFLLEGVYFFSFTVNVSFKEFALLDVGKTMIGVVSKRAE